MPKTRKPVADYITFEQFQQMVHEEPDPMWKLLYRYVWAFFLRVSEVVGQDTHDVKAIKAYRKANKANPKKYLWNGALPGIRPCDIDVQKKTLRVYRKHGKFDVLPFPASDPGLLSDTINYAARKEIWNPEHLNTRLFPRSRRAVLTKMQLFGKTVGGQTLIHPHALRRGGGVHFRERGGILEDLQVVYNHEKMSQTLDYIGKDKRAALKGFAELRA